MIILGKNPNNLVLEDIDRIIHSQIPESKTLDYKAELKIEKGDDRKEFLADISAFINTEGGVLIFGIKELKDGSGQNSGIPELKTPIKIDNLDKLTQQIEDLVQNNLEPRVGNLGINSIEVEDGKYILIISTQKTFGLPHMVTYKATNKFYKRRNSGKYLVDVYELQYSFVQSLKNREQAERFRQTRVNIVRNLEFIPKLDIEGSFFLHVIPINNLEYEIDFTSQTTLNFLSKKMIPIRNLGWDYQHNLEGFMTFSSNHESAPYSYCQLFRNGVLEFYTSHMHFQRENNPKILDVFGKFLENTTIDYVKKSFEIFKYFQIEAPFIIMISLFDIKNGTLLYQDHWRNSSREINQEKLLLPPTIIYDQQVDLTKELKKVFDILWQTGNMPKSPFYDDAGNRRTN